MERLEACVPLAMTSSTPPTGNKRSQARFASAQKQEPTVQTVEMEREMVQQRMEWYEVVKQAIVT